MADQKPKRPRDMNKLAKSIVDIATNEKNRDEKYQKLKERYYPSKSDGWALVIRGLSNGSE